MTDDAGYAKRMNTLPKHVVSRTLEKLEWNNSHLMGGYIEKEASKLKPLDLWKRPTRKRPNAS